MSIDAEKYKFYLSIKKVYMKKKLLDLEDWKKKQ
jgi:hypothetical protein